MTRDEFDALVSRIEDRLGSRPLALRCRVGLWVALGYAGFLFGLLLLAVLGGLFYAAAGAVDTSVGLILVGLGAVLFAFGGIQAVYFLWVRLSPHPGREIRPSEAPRLFDVLASLREARKTSRLHHVLITPEFNAGVQQLPRLGVFGFSRNRLGIGLPLLEVLTLEQFEAVMAHEFVHLSARHGRFGAWIYRLRRTWERLVQELHEPAKSSAGRAVRKWLLAFVDWYWPRFNAYAFVLSRADEYDADRFSAQWAGVGHAASALWCIECQGRRLREKFWPDLWQRANTQPEPPSGVMRELTAALAEPPDANDAARWMDQAARTLTDHLDTHPSLSDRLRAFGLTVDSCRAGGFPPAPCPSAAALLFGDRLGAIRDAVDSLWQEEASEAWRSRHGRAALLGRRLETLGQVDAEVGADADLLWEKALAVLDLRGPEAAEPLLRQLLALRPTHSAANLVLGQHLLERGQPEGESHLRRILDREEDELFPQACEALAAHFQSAGQTSRLQEVRAQQSRYQVARAAAEQERSMVSPADRLVHHELTPDELAALRDLLVHQSDLHSAYLVRKELKHFPRQRLFVLCVRTRPNFWGRSGADRDAALVSRLIPLVKLPGRVLVIAPHGGFRALARKVMSSPDARVPVDG